ncbi:MAG: branched-chain amino acid ABC transporter permease, partial [Anaerolineales bacterium]|nr:branched-chain amino acid ABC transporter permease [Anaerolineales bacterium]
FQDLDWIGLALWVFRAVIIVLVIWGTIATIIDNPYSRRQWTDIVIFGIAQGSMYALIAIGYTLVYGVLFMINFAHGEFFMSGIMTATIFIATPLAASGFLDRQPILSLLIIAIVAMTVSVGIALLTERVAYRPLRKAPRLVPLITAIGASFFWQYFFAGLYGSQVVPFPVPEQLKGTVSMLGTEVLKTHLLVIVTTVVMLIGLNFFIIRTKTGKSIRAVAEDKDAAALMGINVDRAVSITFATGAAMAGVAGLLFAVVFRQVHFFMGFFPGIKAFTAAVLGGIGSIPGAAVGGLVLGLIESIGPSLFLEGLGIPAPHQLKDVIAFVMLVLVLIFRPQGIMGERLSEKKA